MPQRERDLILHGVSSGDCRVCGAAGAIGGRCWECTFTRPISPVEARKLLAEAQATLSDLASWPYCDLVTLAAVDLGETEIGPAVCTNMGPHDYADDPNARFCIECGAPRA